MKIELIIIGNELLNGKIQDLNTHFLAKQAFSAGFEISKVHIIGDNKEDFTASFNSAKSTADIILTTGGLGPTQDDITKEMLAENLGKEIKYSEEAYTIAKKHYDRGERKYDKEKVGYHNIPVDFTPVLNPIGYAPGLALFENQKFIAALPGVPTEFQAMLQEEIFPLIKKNFKPKSKVKHVIVKTWKVPESKIFNQVSPGLWEKLESYGEVSSLPHMLGVDIGVKLESHSDEENEKKENDILNLIKSSPVNEYIYHIGEESLEEIIVKEAQKKNITIGFAESCTGGLCASRITDISGCSSVFWGSVVSYANEVKIKSLKVKEETLKNHGAVSKETALEMAIGAKDHLAVDIAVTTTGIAGPGGATPGKPVGTVGIGVASKLGSSSELYFLKGNRKSLKQRFSQAALMTLLEEIFKH